MAGTLRPRDPRATDHLDQFSHELWLLNRTTAQQGGPSAGDGFGKESYLADFREFVAQHYSPSFAPATGGPYPGVEASFAWTGLSQRDRAEIARLQGVLAEEARVSIYNGPVQADFPPHASLWDEAPPAVTLLDVSGATTGPGELSNDCRAYFGTGGSRAPSGALGPLPPLSPSPPLRDGCLLARRVIRGLAPGATATLAFVWAYTTPALAAAGATPQALAAKYAPAALDGSLRRATTAAFLTEGYRFSLPRAPPGPWVEREVLWNSFMAHAALTYDDFFNETILDQGTMYRCELER